MYMTATCIYWSTTSITCAPLATDTATSPPVRSGTLTRRWAHRTLLSPWKRTFLKKKMQKARMSQWEKLLQMPQCFTPQLQDLYDREGLPMDVRQYLSAWIESQEWERAASDYNLAMVLYQGLLENLDIRYSRFVQEKSFLKQHNIRRYKQNFQKFQENPCELAQNIWWFLKEETDILRTADLAMQVQSLQVEQEGIETNTQRDLDRRMASLKNEVQCMEHKMVCLEEQQDEFHFKCEIYQMEATADNTEQGKIQLLINNLNESRKDTLCGLNKTLKIAGDLIDTLVNKEIVQWQRRQQKACIGAPDSVCLDQLEKWFTCVAECLFQVREFLFKLQELVEKVSYKNDPVKEHKPLLQSKAEKLLSKLLTSSLVVEVQPSMPQGKGPLVLRTGVQFSVKTRLLVKFPEMKNSMEVHTSIGAPKIKGCRHFNVLGTVTKALSMSESQSGGMVADFRHLTLKEQKSGGGGRGTGDLSLSVTEELHIICFNTTFVLKGMSVDLQATSLPVVVISNSSQLNSAWASVLWFNMLSQDPKDLMFFANSQAAPWPQLGQMLSWQFLSAAKRGLNDDQLEMIALRLFGKQQNYDTCTVDWSKFSKENSPDTFWVWFDSIVVMVKTYLEDLWRDGLIMGFVSKGKEKLLLKQKQRGTFLIRFSESVIGGITFSWVESTNGDPEVKTIQPFTKNDLAQIHFHEIIQNFLILEDENVPENPLQYLYPDTPRDEAFGKYYTDKTGNDNPHLKYIKTRLMFVSKGDKLEPEPYPFRDMTEEDQDQQPVNGECGGDAVFPFQEEFFLQDDPMFWTHLNDDLMPALPNPFN
ncbi:signal transducer and activator of transcription 2 isoform X2 [Nerophis ophidion]|uniref:signal transducer and activator of transcription 2 isoform X2 n=1 Tax=Nerophis ophidion TaxID=159077 RepID=UPI002AE08F12|nr:signal transducer and activator of transcription 2 isoform X2 [Nerophis ophidion]